MVDQTATTYYSTVGRSDKRYWRHTTLSSFALPEVRGSTPASVPDPGDARLEVASAVWNGLLVQPEPRAHRETSGNQALDMSLTAIDVASSLH